MKNVTEINKIVKFLANYRFNQIINQLEDFAENSAQLTESNRVTVSNDAKKILNATEAIIAIGWSQGTNDIYWIQMLDNFSAQSKLAMTNIKVDPAALERVQKVDH